MESPWRSAVDGPSRQLLLELNNLQISTQRHYEEQDKTAEEIASIHRLAMTAASREHDRIRRGAEIEREKDEARTRLQDWAERQEAEKELFRARRELAERELALAKQQREEHEAAEAAEKAAEEQRRAHAAAVQQARLEKERRQAEEARLAAERQAEEQNAAATTEARAKEAALAAQKQRTTLPTPQATSLAAPAASVPQALQQLPKQALPYQAQRETEHRRYLEIHQKLKELRRNLKEYVKSNPSLKTVMSDGRRTIRKCVSQLTIGVRNANKGQKDEVLGVFKRSLSHLHPQLDVPDFLLAPPANVSDPKGPALLLYFFNILAKCAIQQYISEAAIKPEAADPVGVLVSTIFGQADLLWNGVPLIDIMIAKYHYVCPVIFGIWGKENTQAGNLRLGWLMDKSTGKATVAQRHYERMTGLGAGYSSIALRNFDKAPALTNPYPVWHFWQAMANITNVPPDQVTETHMTVLKAMLENSEQRILDFFGDMGLVALKWALVEFPARSEKRDTTAARSLLLLPELWRKDKMFYLP